VRKAYAMTTLEEIKKSHPEVESKLDCQYGQYLGVTAERWKQAKDVYLAEILTGHHSNDKISTWKARDLVKSALNFEPKGICSTYEEDDEIFMEDEFSGNELRGAYLSGILSVTK